MPTTKIGARVSRKLQTPRCPHCKKIIELYEPSDTDAMGLLWPKRKLLLRNGELVPWTIVRGGKVWLYIKDDVDSYIARASIEGVKKDLAKRYPDYDFTKWSDEDMVIFQKQQEAMLRRMEKKHQNEEEDQDNDEADSDQHMNAGGEE